MFIFASCRRAAPQAASAEAALPGAIAALLGACVRESVPSLRVLDGPASEAEALAAAYRLGRKVHLARQALRFVPPEQAPPPHHVSWCSAAARPISTG